MAVLTNNLLLVVNHWKTMNLIFQHKHCGICIKHMEPNEHPVVLYSFRSCHIKFQVYAYRRSICFGSSHFEKWQFTFPQSPDTKCSSSGAWMSLKTMAWKWNIPETVLSADKVIAGELMTSFTLAFTCFPHNQNIGVMYPLCAVPP